jgi:hypothetical protein
MRMLADLLGSDIINGMGKQHYIEHNPGSPPEQPQTLSGCAVLSLPHPLVYLHPSYVSPLQLTWLSHAAGRSLPNHTTRA